MIITGCTIEIIDVLKQNLDGSYDNERIYRDRATGAILTGVTSDQIFTGSTRDFERIELIDDVNNDGTVLNYFNRFIDIEGTIIGDFDVSGNTYIVSGSTHFSDEIFLTDETSYFEDTTTGGTIASGAYTVSFSYEALSFPVPPITYIDDGVNGPTRINPGKSVTFEHSPNGRLGEFTYTGATDFFITVVR
jgi:hypothetical protein